jgi:hypothetical protein
MILGVGISRGVVEPQTNRQDAKKKRHPLYSCRHGGSSEDRKPPRRQEEKKNLNQFDEDEPPRRQEEKTFLYS